MIWAKNFTRPHTCSELCNSHYIISDNLIRLTYQTGCLFPEKVEPAYIHLSQVNSEEKTVYLDETLPLRGTVKLLMEHPLRRPQVQVHTFDEDVSLSTLVRMFHEWYERVYREEEETSTHKEHWIPQKCPDCTEETYTDAKIDDFVTILEQPEDCSICFDETIHADDALVRIRKCRHAFHRSCLLRWFNTPRPRDSDLDPDEKHNSCPICRQPIITCETCDSTRILKRRYFGAVPPHDPNNDEQIDRPETDGPYGIHTIYYEDLFFKGLVYDSNARTVRLLPLERLID